MTQKQLDYIHCLTRATEFIDSGEAIGCCAALDIAAVENAGIHRIKTYNALIDLLMDIFENSPIDTYWWGLTEEGKLQRILALSFLIDMIETENLFS